MSVLNANLADGVDASAPYGLWLRFAFTGAWADGESWSLTLSADAINYTLGTGILSGTVPVFAQTLDDRLYICAGSALYFSGLGDSLSWEQQDAQAGFIELLNRYSTAEDLQALATYQGGLLAVQRRTVQRWAIDPAPANFQQGQVLDNIGTFAPLTVKAIGEADVYMLYDSGVRSVRVRDASNNAILSDVGVPVDKLVKANLRALSDEEKAKACGAVDPETNAYWCFIPGPAGAEGVIYVFSKYETSGVAAWSTYRPTSGAAKTVFTPEKFCLLDGRIYVRATDGTIYQYGGPTGNTYENCGVTADTPFSAAQQPGTCKQFSGVDVAAEGKWRISLGTQTSKPDALKLIYNGTNESFERGASIGLPMGTHFKLRLEEASDGYALFAQAVVHFILNSEK
jgi:hypothetical protein